MTKFLVAAVFMTTVAAIATAGPSAGETSAKKDIGVSCKSNSDCKSGYCKPNKAHLPGYVGTCQRK